MRALTHRRQHLARRDAEVAETVRRFRRAEMRALISRAGYYPEA